MVQAIFKHFRAIYSIYGTVTQKSANFDTFFEKILAVKQVLLLLYPNIMVLLETTSFFKRRFLKRYHS
jgi:hypothetical protein